MFGSAVLAWHGRSSQRRGLRRSLLAAPLTAAIAVALSACTLNVSGGDYRQPATQAPNKSTAPTASVEPSESVEPITENGAAFDRVLDRLRQQAQLDKDASEGTFADVTADGGVQDGIRVIVLSFTYAKAVDWPQITEYFNAHTDTLNEACADVFTDARSEGVEGPMRVEWSYLNGGGAEGQFNYECTDG